MFLNVDLKRTGVHQVLALDWNTIPKCHPTILWVFSINVFMDYISLKYKAISGPSNTRTILPKFII